MAMKVLFFLLVVAFIIFLLFGVLLLGGLLEHSFLVKGSPFECGFYSFSLSGVSFSMSFFIISLIFIIFDVEILLLCFYPFSSVFIFYTSFYLSLVILFIFLATLYE